MAEDTADPSAARSSAHNFRPVVGMIAFSVALIFLLVTTSQRSSERMAQESGASDVDDGDGPRMALDVEHHMPSAKVSAAIEAANSSSPQWAQPSAPQVTADRAIDAVVFDTKKDHVLQWRGGGCFKGSTVANTAKLWRNCDGAGGPVPSSSPRPTVATVAPGKDENASNATSADEDDDSDHESAKLSRPGRVHCAFGAAATDAVMGPMGFRSNRGYGTFNASHRCLVWQRGTWCAGSRADGEEQGGAGCRQPALLTSKELRTIATNVSASRRRCAFDFLRRPQDDATDGAFAVDATTGRVHVKLPEPCSDAGPGGSAEESFSAVELLALLHRAGGNGTRPIVLSGDSMLRQLLFRLVFAVRGKQPAVEYNGWFDVTYVVRGRGDELQYRISSKSVARQILRNLDDDEIAAVLNPPRLPCHVGPSVSDAEQCLVHVQFLWEPYEDTYSRALFLRNRPPADPRADAALMRAARGVEEAEATSLASAATAADKDGDDDSKADGGDAVTITRARKGAGVAKGRGRVDPSKCRPYVVFDREGYHVSVPAQFVPALHIHAAMYWFPIGRSTKKQRAMRKASAESSSLLESSVDAADQDDDDADASEDDNAPGMRRAFGAQSNAAHRVRTGQKRKSSKPIKQLRRIMKFFEHMAAGSQHLAWQPSGRGITDKDCPAPSQRTRVGYHFFSMGAPLLRGSSVNTSANANEELRNRNQMVVRRNHAAGTAVNRGANHTGVLCEASDRAANADGVKPDPTDRPSLLDAGASLQFVDFQGLLRRMTPRELRERSKDAKHFLCSLHPPYPRPVYGSADDHKGCADDINLAVWTWVMRAVLELSRMPADGPEGATADTWYPA